jgi:hypothetical protein
VKRLRDRADEDLDRLRALLTAWRQQFEGTARTLAEAIKHAEASGDLYDALAAFCRSGKPEAKPIGYAFRKVQGRPLGKKVLGREQLDGDGIARWVVQLCG